jgi:hypothetical protein
MAYLVRHIAGDWGDVDKHPRSCCGRLAAQDEMLAAMMTPSNAVN